MLYKEASRILQIVASKKGTIKNLVLSSKYQNKKQLYALVCEAHKYRSVLLPIIESTKLQKHEKILGQENLALVLTYDLLLGKGLHGPDDKFKEAILKHKAALKSKIASLKVKVGATKNEDLLPSKFKDQEALPRYVRINTLKSSVEDVIEHFRSEQYQQVPISSHYDSFLAAVASLKKKQFLQDPHIPVVLVFPPKTDLHDHILYQNGSIIFQDKASCLPAHILAPPPGSHVIDSCAAPGNKTTHLAALLGNKGKLFAFDKDAKRLSTLNTQLNKTGVLCASTTRGDFLETDPTDPKYAKVEYILVDPSCSGSGIVNRQHEATDDSDSTSPERLNKLANFQVMILSHALTFPSVKKVVYSTCSVHQQENEEVVAEVLELLENHFKLVGALKELPSRGLKVSVGEDQRNFDGRKCLRLDPKKDLCNGFFVACLERKQKSGALDLVAIRNKNLKRNSNDETKESTTETDMKPEITEEPALNPAKKRKIETQVTESEPLPKKKGKKEKAKQKNSVNQPEKKPKEKKPKKKAAPVKVVESPTETTFQSVSNRKSQKGKHKKKHSKVHRPVTG